MCSVDTIRCPITHEDYREDSLAIYRLCCCKQYVSIEGIREWLIEHETCPFCRAHRRISLNGFEHPSLALRRPLPPPQPPQPSFSFSPPASPLTSFRGREEDDDQVEEIEQEEDLGDYNLSKYMFSDDDDDEEEDEDDDEEEEERWHFQEDEEEGEYIEQRMTRPAIFVGVL